MITNILSLDVKDMKKAYKDMTISFVRLLKLKILKRDEFRCQHCRSKKNLTIAHIIPVYNGKGRMPMHYKDVDNCITLCVQCHLAFDNKRRNS
jgi:5-methylcytosine-specific restriction endonuclease McrA